LPHAGVSVAVVGAILNDAADEVPGQNNEEDDEARRRRAGDLPCFVGPVLT
jgi:hypothetical protein